MKKTCAIIFSLCFLNTVLAQYKPRTQERLGVIRVIKKPKKIGITLSIQPLNGDSFPDILPIPDKGMEVINTFFNRQFTIPPYIEKLSDLPVRVELRVDFNYNLTLVMKSGILNGYDQNIDKESLRIMDLMVLISLLKKEQLEKAKLEQFQRYQINWVKQKKMRPMKGNYTTHSFKFILTFSDAGTWPPISCSVITKSAEKIVSFYY